MIMFKKFMKGKKVKETPKEEVKVEKLWARTRDGEIKQVSPEELEAIQKKGGRKLD